MDSMKILLIEPTDRLLLTPSLALRGNTLEPYACEIIAAYVEQKCKDVEVKVYQQGELEDRELAEFIVREKPDIVGFSVLTCNYHRTSQIAYFIKQHARDIKIVFGGQHPSIETDTVIKNEYVDFVVFGEGEETFKELVDTIKNGKTDYSSIKGLAYKANGNVKQNGIRERIKDLDLLSPAKRDAEYLYKVRGANGIEIKSKLALPDCRNWNLCYPTHEEQRGVAQVQYSRGCGFSCTFCVTPALWCERTEPNGHKVTFRSPAKITEEIQDIKKLYGVKFFYFNDVTFNFDLNKMHALCEALIKAGLHEPHEFNIAKEKEPPDNIHWFCLARIGISKDDALLLANAGCSKIGLGIESFDEAIVKTYNKGYNWNNIGETLKNTDAVGIINRVYIVIGGPDETKESIGKILDGLLSHPIDQIRVAFAVPYPSTPAFTKWEKSIVIKDYSRWTEEEPVVECSIPAKELIAKRRWLIESFYNNKKYKERVKSKIKRFPYLEDSYKAFDEELRMLSGNSIKII